MNPVLICLAISVLLGAALGLVLRVWAVALASLLIAGLSAAYLQMQGFGAVSGIAAATCCLVACQLGYVMASFVSARGTAPLLSAQHDIDGEPGDGRHNGVGQDNGEHDERHPRPPLPKA